MRISQRAADIVAAFGRVVDLLVETVRPDVVIHSGDLFDSAHPHMSVIHTAMGQLRRISDAGIPTLIVEGHHSYPRERAMGHVLQLLGYLPRVRVVCDAYEDIRFDGLPLAIHALPHAPLFNGSDPREDCLDPSVPNILVAHGVVDNMPFYQTGRAAPAIYLRPCQDWYDYVALGHCHRFCQPNLYSRAFYAGAPTMITWGDFAAGQGFSINMVEIGRDEPRVERVPVPGRAMHAYGLDDATGLSAKEILGHLANQVADSPPGDAYCRVHVVDIDPLARKELDWREVEDLFTLAADLDRVLKPRDPPWARALAAREAGGAPSDRYDRVVQECDGDEAFRAEVRELGLELLNRAQADVVVDEG